MNKLPIGAGLTLPAADMGVAILERMQEFAEQPGMEPFKKALEFRPIPNGKMRGINRFSIADLIAAMYLDQLHNFCKWNNGATEAYTNAQWARMVENWNEIPTKIESELFNKVIQPAYEEIHDWILWFSENQDDWSIWYVRRDGLDVLIVRGEDYRILDWERRMAKAADYVEAEEKGEPLAAHTWVPDDDARRFVELLKQQQREPSPLGKTAIDAHDSDREARRFKGRPIARSFRKPSGSSL